MVPIFILLRVLFHFFIFILFIYFLDFALFLVFWGVSWFSGGVPGFLGSVPGFLGVFRVFWGVFRVLGGVPGCSGVPGSTTCLDYAYSHLVEVSNDQMDYHAYFFNM